MLISLLSKLQTQQYLIIAHRGASGDFLENTITAFSKAVELGADMIELDVRATKDNKIVCYHDEIINNLKIATQDFAQLDKHNIPLLSEVLAQFHKKIYFVIELKQLTSNMLEQISQLISQYNLLGKVIFASEHEQYLQDVKQALGGQVYCCMVLNVMSDRQFAVDCSFVDGIICHVTELDSPHLQNLQACYAKEDSNWFGYNLARPAIGVYGVATAEHVAACQRHGVRFIGTDYPAEIRKITGNYSCS